MFDPRSTEFKKVVSNLALRAETAAGDEYQASVFVGHDLITRLDNRNNQIVIGRRGTGKTHLFQALKNREVFSDPNSSFLYIDLRRILTGNSQSRPNEPSVADEFFVKLLGQIENHLTNVVVSLESVAESDLRRAELAWDNLVSEFSRPRDENTRVFRYPELRSAIERMVFETKLTRLTILLDEWVHVSWEAQPFLAEHLKQLILPAKLLALKIASIEFQQTLRSQHGGRWIGFEAGPEISCDVDLDTYLVVDREEDHVTKFFGEILFNHLAVGLGDQVQIRLSVDEKYDAIVKSLFTERRAFVELVRASEGVARDFLQVFAKAYFECYLPGQRTGRDRIDIKAVRRAAREWFTKDKLASLQSDDQTMSLLKEIRALIGDRNARSFMVHNENARHPLLQRLFDGRLIHRLKTSYSHPDQPGERFDVFTIDYGTYVDLIGTVKQPNLFMEESNQDDDVIVPFDDGRSIRRIVLTKNHLDAATTSRRVPV